MLIYVDTKYAICEKWILDHDYGVSFSSEKNQHEFN